MYQMYQEILEKKTVLDQQKPFGAETRNRIARLDEEDGIYMNLMLDGTELSRRDVASMIRGELVTDAPIRGYTFVENYAAGLRLVRDCLALGNCLDERFLLKFHSCLTGKEAGYRQTDVTVKDFSHVPAPHAEIRKRVNRLLREVYQTDEAYLVNAAHLHCGLMEIYPFEEYSEVMAGAAMNYYLEEKGFFPIALGYNRNEYLETVNKCFLEKNEGVFVWGLERAVYNKLEVLLQIIAEDGEGSK